MKNYNVPIILLVVVNYNRTEFIFPYYGAGCVDLFLFTDIENMEVEEARTPLEVPTMSDAPVLPPKPKPSELFYDP